MSDLVFNFPEGEVLLIDKPLKWTSFDVVNKVRYEIRKKLEIERKSSPLENQSFPKLKNLKVGHAGTLDPLASGLLIVCTGKMTKRITEFQEQEKEYIGTIQFGAMTPSYDLETEPEGTYPTAHIADSILRETALGFVGEIKQVPPLFSAKKLDGERAYLKARRGEDTQLEARAVTIQGFTLGEWDADSHSVDFRVQCSKGTYIRSLAHDFGVAMGSGAYLKTLRRTKIGDFALDQAWSMERLIQAIKN
jgi:tRNA pseudouridine55 synthase